MYLIINNSLSESTFVMLPKEADRYTLSAKFLRNDVMLLNGNELRLSPQGELPTFSPARQQSGMIELKSGTCTFLVL